MLAAVCISFVVLNVGKVSNNKTMRYWLINVSDGKVNIANLASKMLDSFISPTMPHFFWYRNSLDKLSFAPL